MDIPERAAESNRAGARACDAATDRGPVPADDVPVPEAVKMTIVVAVDVGRELTAGQVVVTIACA